MTGMWLEDISTWAKILHIRLMRTLREVLDGKEAKDILLQVAGKFNYYLSYPILQKAGIPTSLYPDNAVYLFAPEGFWEQARYMLLAIIVLLFITYLLWIRLRLFEKRESVTRSGVGSFGKI